jgi:adenylate kinase
MRMLLLAPPGAGKGTLGDGLADHYGIAHLSSGEILRAQIRAGSQLGREVAAVVAAGDLVPDAVLESLMRPAISAAAQAGGYVLDGFPRNLAQARSAHGWAVEQEIRLHAVVHLDVPPDVLAARLVARAGVEGRSDDTPATVRRRMDVYWSDTAPLLDYYGGRGLVLDVDGTPQPGEVLAAAVKALAAFTTG